MLKAPNKGKFFNPDFEDQRTIIDPNSLFALRMGGFDRKYKKNDKVIAKFFGETDERKIAKKVNNV